MSTTKKRLKPFLLDPAFRSKIGLPKLSKAKAYDLHQGKVLCFYHLQYEIDLRQVGGTI